MLNRRTLLMGIAGLLGLGRGLAKAETLPLISANNHAEQQPILVNGWVLLPQDLEQNEVEGRA